MKIIKIIEMPGTGINLGSKHSKTSAVIEYGKY